MIWACPLRFGVGLYAGRDVACHACTSFATLIAGFPLLSLTRMRAYLLRTHTEKRSVFYLIFTRGRVGGQTRKPLKKTLLLR